MNLKHLFLLIALPIALIASPLPEYPFVHVQGVAEVKVEPDMATIQLSITSFSKEAEDAQKGLSESSSNLYSVLVKLEISDEDSVAGTIEKNVARNEDEFGNDLEIIGYTMQRKVTVHVNDLKVYPELIEYLYQTKNIEDIEVIFNRSDRQRVLEDLVTDACVDATEQANRLAKGFGSKVKSVKAISESELERVFGVYGLPEGTSYRYGGRVKSGTDFRVIPATITITKGVYAIFEIE